MPYINIDTEVYVDFEDFNQEELKKYAMEEFDLVENASIEGSLEFLKELKKSSSGYSEWVNVRHQLEELIKD